MNDAASNWNGYHANMAASYFAPCDKRFLIIGCNRVEDCRYFIDMGSRHVVGFDIMIEIVVNLVHPKVSYIRAPAEMMPLPDDEFDLVYAFATLEHIPKRTPGDGACLSTGRGPPFGGVASLELPIGTSLGIDLQRLPVDPSPSVDRRNYLLLRGAASA